MNKFIITLAAALCVGVTATAFASAAPAEGGEPATALAARERKDAERCGVAAEQWKTMTKKARKEARQAAQAKALGLTVAEMKAKRNREAAEKAGCDPEKWSKMSVKERCAFRKAAKATGQVQAPVQAE